MGRNSYCDPEVSMALLSPNVVLLGVGGVLESGFGRMCIISSDNEI